MQFFRTLYQQLGDYFRQSRASRSMLQETEERKQGREHPRADVAGAEEDGDGSPRADLRRLAGQVHGKVGLLLVATFGLLTLALFYTLYFARAFFLPVILALLFDRLLTPVIRFLKRLKIPEPLGAAVVLVGFVGFAGLTVYELSGPAAEWLEKAPDTLREVEYKLRGLKEPVEKISRAAEQVEEATRVGDREQNAAVEVQGQSFAETVMGQTRVFLAGAAVMLFLLYFLLASGDLFLRKLVEVLPGLRDKRKAVAITRAMERDLSVYLFTVTMINAGLGVLVAAGLYLIGMPSPFLWGLLVGVLNYIPYLGPVVGIVIITLVALVSFDTVGQALAAPAVYFAVNSLEAYIVTPLVMGRRLTLNPVMIFVSLTFWGWIWGIPGALLAVPLLVAFKIFCDNIETLKPIGAFLGR
jgi:predicted PurR-regulated permease PerM